MNEIFMPIAIFIPIILGIAILFIPFKNRKQMMIYIESVILLTSVVAVMLILNRPDDLFILFSFAGNLKVGFDLDGVGSVFVGIVSLLWPLATLYAFEYMEHENHQKTFPPKNQTKSDVKKTWMCHGLLYALKEAESLSFPPLSFFYQFIRSTSLAHITATSARVALPFGFTLPSLPLMIPAATIEAMGFTA